MVEGKFVLIFVREFLTFSVIKITGIRRHGKGGRFEFTLSKGSYRFMKENDTKKPSMFKKRSGRKAGTHLTFTVNPPKNYGTRFEYLH